MRNLLFVFLLSSLFARAQKEVRLYDGPAPGSENWNWTEKRNNNNMTHQMLVYNVVNPTLTVFPGDTALSTGAAVIICPGGAFHFLSIDNEGTIVAKWLAKRGVTAFVLKYRTAHIDTDDPLGDMMAGLSPGKRKDSYEAEMKVTIPLCISDGKAAIAYVRKHAAEFGVSPDRIGIIGFSAGGTVTAASAFNYTSDNKPDFVAPIYAYVPDMLLSDVSSDAPPMFLSCASDDQLGLAPNSITLYNKWLASKHSAEIHIYAKGGHGFGMNVQHLPVDEWIDRYGDWLVFIGMMKPKS
ncbi:MAG TPA: alpha/beta hydrolase [Puia sp.]|jgi:acetyl esterase/lipase|nr:alpha/beta hydrolase [Puia sp.]